MRPQSRDQAAAILAALGGVDNIDEIEPCTTRLRSLVRDAGRVDAAGLRAAGAFGVMISGRVVQVVVGPHVDLIATDLDEADVREPDMTKAEKILAALGGDANVLDLEPCITRLRVEVENPALVDEPGLKAAGAIAVVRSGVAVQVIVGPEADTLASDIEDLR